MSNVKCQKCQNCTFFHYTLYINKIRLGIAPSFSVILDARSPKKTHRIASFFSFYLFFYLIRADLQSRVYNARKFLCIQKLYTFVVITMTISYYCYLRSQSKIRKEPRLSPDSYVVCDEFDLANQLIRPGRCIRNYCSWQMGTGCGDRHPDGCGDAPRCVRSNQAGFAP